MPRQFLDNPADYPGFRFGIGIVKLKSKQAVRFSFTSLVDLSIIDSRTAYKYNVSSFNLRKSRFWYLYNQKY